MVDAVFSLRNLWQLETATKSTSKLFKNHPELYGKPIVIDQEKCKIVVILDVEEITATQESLKRLGLNKQRLSQYENYTNKYTRRNKGMY